MLPADLDLVGEQALDAEGLAQGNASLHHVLLPHLVDHFVSEVPAEGSFVAQEGRADQTISQQTHSPLLQLLEILCPAAGKQYFTANTL